MKKVLAVVLAICLVTCCFVGCGKKNSTTTQNTAKTETIKIGLIAPLTGSAAVYGLSVQKGVNMAVKEINAKQSNYKIEVLTEDSQGDATVGASAFTKLAGEGIKALVGPVITSVAAAVTGLVNEEEIPMITPSATGDAVTTKADYVFRSCYADSFQGKMAANFAAEKGFKEVGVLYASGDPYSKGLRDAFVANCKTLGITVKTEQKSETIDNETDFSSQFAAIKKSGVQFLYAPYYYSAIGPTITPQARGAGYTGIIMGSDGYDGVLDYVKTGDVTIYDNVFYTNHYSVESTEAAVVNFVKAYKAAYKNEEPNAFAALAYDCVYMLKQSLDSCGGKYESANIKDNLTGMTFSGVTGNFTLDETGTPQKSVVIMKLVSDKANKKVTAKYVETIDK